MAEQRRPLAYQWRRATHNQVEMFRVPENKKRLVESMAERSRCGSRLGAMASRRPTLRGSGQAANRPSPHPAMRAPPCF